MKREKKKRGRLGLIAGFTIFIVISFLTITTVYAGLVELVHQKLDIGRTVPDMVWFIIICAILGSVVTWFAIQWFLLPLSELRNAMNKVAEGDFAVRLETKKGAGKDIRQLNENFNIMAKELGNTEILQSDFVSNVSHEFKTPISAIEGYATLLQGGENISAEEYEYIEKILFNTQRLSTLVGNMLLLSKVDNQSIPDRHTTFRLDEQIRQSIVSLESRWTAKETEFEAELEEISYTGNEILLIHVWNNLIENAIKFGPKGGLIRIQLRQDGEKVIFTIEDEGPGITAEEKKHIFDRFYQADSSHKEEGNGLGLSLVKQILAVSDGEIEAENLDYGGCRFTVILNI